MVYGVWRMAKTTVVLDDFVLLKEKQASAGNLSKFIEKLLRKEVLNERESMFGAFSKSKLSVKGLREKKEGVD